MNLFETKPTPIPVEVLNFPQSDDSSTWIALAAVLATVVVAVAGFIVNPFIEKGKWLRAERQIAYSYYLDANLRAMDSLLVIRQNLREGGQTSQVRSQYAKLDAASVDLGVAQARIELLVDQELRDQLSATGLALNRGIAEVTDAGVGQEPDIITEETFNSYKLNSALASRMMRETLGIQPSLLGRARGKFN